MADSPSSSPPPPAIASTPTPPQPLTASVHWVDGERFVAQAASQHALVLDGGSPSTGPRPMELVLQALCGCTAIDVALILRKARQNFTALEVSASAERAPTHPRVFTHIHLRFRVAGSGLDRAAVERAVGLSQDKYCSVSRSLDPRIKLSREIEIDDTMAVAPAGS